MAFTTDETGAVSASLDGTLRLWDASTGDEVRRLEGADPAYWGVSVSPDGREATGVTLLGSIRLWDLADGMTNRRREAPETHDLPATFTPDGRLLMPTHSGRGLCIGISSPPTCCWRAVSTG